MINKEVITIEAVGKFGPKANGKWYGVKRPLTTSGFAKGLTYEVETEGWESKGKTGINIVNIIKTVEPEAPTSVGNNASSTTMTANSLPAITKTVYNSSDSKQKDRRILVQGIVQAVVQSPSLAGLPFTTSDEVVNHVLKVSKSLIEFVESGN